MAIVQTVDVVGVLDSGLAIAIAVMINLDR